MPAFYLDASAVVKHYLPEAGSDLVSQLLVEPASGDSFHTSLLSTVEVASAIYRQVRAGRLERPWARAALTRFGATLAAQFTVWPLREETTAAAVLVAEEHGLRAQDALHLATALGIAALAPRSRCCW